MGNKLDHIIQSLCLQPHPEGGFFRETYRSSGVINPDSLKPGYQGERNYSTCIYFLLTSEVFSAFQPDSSGRNLAFLRRGRRSRCI